MNKVFVILVNYNGYEDTFECVQSLKKISYKNFKIIIVDNNSTDNSLLNLKKHLNDCIIIESKKNLGFAGGNNLGIKYALNNGADFVLLLNNDTIVESEFLGKLVEVFDMNSLVGVVGGKIYYYSQPTKIWYAGGKINKFTGSTKHIGVNKIDNINYNEVNYTEYVTGCMMLISRQVIEKVGLMDEKYFLYYEETDWNVRIKKSGFKIVYTPYAKIYHKVSSSTQNISAKLECYYNRNRYYFVMKNFKMINKIFIFFYMRLRLFAKYLIAGIKNDTEKQIAIKYAFYSIKKHRMGEIK